MISVPLVHLKFLNGICRLRRRNFKWAALTALPLLDDEKGEDETAMLLKGFYGFRRRVQMA